MKGVWSCSYLFNLFGKEELRIAIALEAWGAGCGAVVDNPEIGCEQCSPEEEGTG